MWFGVLNVNCKSLDFSIGDTEPEEVFRLSNQKPRWEDGLYRFAFYPFEEAVRLNGIFYVGIEQQGSFGDLLYRGWGGKVTLGEAGGRGQIVKGCGQLCFYRGGH